MINLAAISTEELLDELSRRSGGTGTGAAAARYSRIIRACSLAWGVCPSEITTKSRNGQVCDARTCAMALVRETGAELRVVAMAFRKLDHSTVSYALRRHSDRMRTDEAYAAMERKARAILEENGKEAR